MIDKLNYFENELMKFHIEGIETFPHRDVLFAKISNTKKAKRSAFRNESDIDLFLPPYLEYLNVLKKIMSLKSSVQKRIKMVKALEKYQHNVKKLNRTLLSGRLYFTSQSKYESTILEEFLTLYLSDLLIGNLKIGSIKIDSRSKKDTSFDVRNGVFNSNTYNEKKDQDVAIYFNQDEEENLVMAAEVKSSYIDKTMINGITNTFRDVHKGSEKVMTAIVSESIILDGLYIFDSDIKVYCLKKLGTSDPLCEHPFYPCVFEKFYDDTKKHLKMLKTEHLTHKEILMTKGYLS